MGLKNLKSILPEVVYDQVVNRFTNLNRFAKVTFDFEVNDKNVLITASQYEKLTDDIYSPEQLIKFTRDFSDIIENQGFTVNIVAKPYSGDEISMISALWVKAKMDEKGITQRALAKDLGVDHFIMSKLLSNKLGFTRWHKAAFFYYFKNI